MDSKAAPPYGEVIASDSQLLQVECHSLYEAPRFGSFVRADCIGSERSHYGVVTGVATGPRESTRTVQAHRMPPGELEQRKPHLPMLLRTTFEARLVGYGQGAVRIAGTPPLPAHLHCYVYPAVDEEIREVTSTPDFLRPLVQVQGVPQADLVVCAIEEARRAWGSDEKLVAWGKFLVRLLRQDYVTLESILQRISPAVAVPIPPPAAPAAHPRWEADHSLIAGNGPRRGRDPFED
jgi:hypothetical protein